MNTTLKTEIAQAVGTAETLDISLNGDGVICIDTQCAAAPPTRTHSISRPALLDALKRLSTQSFEVEYDAKETQSEINAISIKIIALQRTLATITPDISNLTARYSGDSLNTTPTIAGNPTADAAIRLGKQIYHIETQIATAQNELQRATTRYDSLQREIAPFVGILASLAPWEARILRLRHGGAADKSEQGYTVHRNSGGLRYSSKKLSYHEIGDDAAVSMDEDSVRDNTVRIALAFYPLYLPSERIVIAGG